MYELNKITERCYYINCPAKIFVPAHAPVTDDITELADIYVAKVHEIAENFLLCLKIICYFGSVFREISILEGKKH